MFWEEQKTREHCLCFALGYFFFLLCPLPKSPAFIDRWFRFLSGFFLPLTFFFFVTVFRIKADVRDPNMRGITSEPDKHFSSAASDCSSSSPNLHQVSLRGPSKSRRGLQTPQQASPLVPSHLVSNLSRKCGDGKLLVITEV